jgi:transposase-like protein
MARMTTLQDRATIDQLAHLGYTDSQIAAEVGWTVRTVRKWRRRAQRDGRKGLASTMGRPATGPLSSYPSRLRETLRVWRVKHPGWGPNTLRAELEADESFKGQQLPCPSSIANFLKKQGLTRPYERHNELPQPQSQVASAPHEEWEMDSRGQERVSGVGMIALINLSDVFSKAKVISYPCLVGQERATRRPRAEDYQLVLRLAFTEWGLPNRIAVDHDSVFYDNTCKSPFPTRLHSWLLALGVDLVFGRPGRPTDQATVERSHQTWAQQALVGQTFADWDRLRAYLEQRRHFLNYQLPCSTLGNLPPVVAHPEALHPRRLYRPEWETELLDLSRIYDYLSKGRWFRQVSQVGTVSLGRQTYGLGVTWSREVVEITFDPADRHLVFCSAAGERKKRLSLQGITIIDLMGEMGPLVNLDHFQLALPFTWNEWRVTRLCETLGGTT